MSATGAPPETLFHYTSAEGALGILETGSVRASMVHYMNDARELHYALDLAQEQIFDTAHHSESYARDLCKEFVAAVQLIAIYAFSLSSQRDQLSQWRAYAGNGGYAIGIARTLLEQVARSNDAMLVRCEYDVDKQRALLAPVVADMLSHATVTQNDSHLGGLYEAFAERFVRAAASIKHPSFREEEEWRLISGLGIDRARVRYRTARGLVVPFTEWSLRIGGQYPIATVVVGPTLPGALASRSLHHLTVASFGWPVKVEFSESPLRSPG
ncbi:MAG: DUF2971 domain-containing protein [Gemmatimonadaceae bacterium]